jgi:uncharacterized delta-60 repeat protein
MPPGQKCKIFARPAYAAKEPMGVNIMRFLKNRVTTALVVSVMTGSFAVLSEVNAAPGDLDPTFGIGGKVITTGIGGISDIAIQPDGKIVAVSGARIVRYNANGSLDSSFGEGGMVLIPAGPLAAVYLSSVAIQSDGKIVVAAEIDSLVDPPSSYLIRLDTNGVLDTTFNSGSTMNGGGDSVAIQADGKLLTCGWDGFSTLTRYHSNGQPDTSFNGTGGVITPDSSAFSVAVQADGKILVAGSRGSGYPGQFIIFRYNTDGSRDTSFGTNGTVTPTFPGHPGDSYGRKLAVQADGKIVAAGVAAGVQLIVRFDPNGSLDTAFGNNGVVFAFSGDVAIQADGKIVTVGSFNDDFGVARYNSNGTLDTTFGGDGLVSTNLGGLDGASAVAIQSDGKIVAAGNSSNWHSALARYRGARTPFDFDSDGRSDVSVFRPSDKVWYLNKSTEGFSATQFGLSTDKITPADYDGDGKTDIAVFRDGIWWRINSSNSTVAAVQFGQAGDLPVPADYTGDGRDELAVYRGGTWWAYDLANNQTQAIQFGLPGDKPTPADYDGDGRADHAVYRDGTWYLNRSSNGFTAFPFGLATDRPVIADYDGDGKADPAVYRDGTWYLLRSTQGFAAFQFGLATDIPAPADYDGDGKTDAAVYRNGVWYLLQSTSGLAVQQFGLSNDRPVPAAFVP